MSTRIPITSPSHPLHVLRYHVTGKIERGEGQPIIGIPAHPRRVKKFKVGQRVRVSARCAYYPDNPGIPAATSLNRYAFIRSILCGGQAFGVEVTGYPNIIDYSARELSRA